MREEVVRTQPLNCLKAEDAMSYCDVQDGDPFDPPGASLGEPPTHCYFWAVFETAEVLQQGLEPHLPQLRKQVLTKRIRTESEKLNMELTSRRNGVWNVGTKDAPKYLPVKYGRMLYMVYLGKCDESSHVWVRDNRVLWERIERVDSRSAQKMRDAEDGDPANRFFLKMGEVVHRAVPMHCYLWGFDGDYDEIHGFVQSRTPQLRARVLAEYLRKKPPPPPPEPFKVTPKLPPAPKPKPVPVEILCSVCKQRIEKWESRRKSFGGVRHTNCVAEEMKPLGAVAAIDADGKNVYARGYRRADGVWVCPKGSSSIDIRRATVNTSVRGRIPGTDGGCCWTPKFRYW
jgi:hypothetical protein